LIAPGKIRRAAGRSGGRRGFRADAEQEAPSGHAGKSRADGRQQRACEADGGRCEHHAARAEAIHQPAADEQQDDLRQAVDGVEPAYFAVAETTLPLQQLRDRADRVVEVEVAEVRERHDRQHEPGDSGGIRRGLRHFR
jgi:FtsZ-interacting cell division protein ZipA